VIENQAQPFRYLEAPEVFSAGAIRLATWLDLLSFIPIYVSFLALLVVYARRGLPYLPQNRPAAAFDLCMSAVPLVLLTVADVMEDLGVFAGLDVFGGRAIPWIRVWTEAKFVLLAVVMVYLLVAVLLPLVISQANRAIGKPKNLRSVGT